MYLLHKWQIWTFGLGLIKCEVFQTVKHKKSFYFSIPLTKIQLY